jgi:hypothetical protein
MTIAGQVASTIWYDTIAGAPSPILYAELHARNISDAIPDFNLSKPQAMLPAMQTGDFRRAGPINDLPHLVDLIGFDSSKTATWRQCLSTDFRAGEIV